MIFQHKFQLCSEIIKPFSRYISKNFAQFLKYMEICRKIEIPMYRVLNLMHNHYALNLCVCVSFVPVYNENALN